MLKIEKIIKRDWESYTPSEQKLATFFLSHLQDLPFETAASIGKQVTVSPMTVGRYIKKLGYNDLRDIKAELRSSGAWNGADSKAIYVPASLKSKVKGLADVYRIAQSPDWSRITSMIARASTVHVASFQMGRYFGLGFSAFLQNLRPRVFFSDGGDGSYADVLLDTDPDACLVLIDFRRYSRHFRLLAEEAKARNIRTVILTDVYCHWARAITDDVLMIETDFGVRSLSMAQLLLELLLAAVAQELKGTESRLEATHRLRQKFIGSEDAAGPPRTGKRAR